MDRNKLIDNSKWCEQYRIFLKQNINEPLPKTPQWKNNVNYVLWADEKHREYKLLNNIPTRAHPMSYYKEYILWLRIKCA